MSGGRGWLYLAIVTSGLCFGCGEQVEGGKDPSASEREGRSDVLRGLMAAKDQPAEPERGKGDSGQEPSAVTPGPPGTGGSGSPDSTKSVQGRVTWVGDNELLIRDTGGVERDLGVNPGTRLLMKGEPVTLPELREGDEVRVRYEEGTGGWVAHQVEVLPRRESAPPAQQGPRSQTGGSKQGGQEAPPR